MLIHPKYIAGAVAFMTLAVSGPTWAQPLDGFESARWGMSMQQVQSAFSGRLVSFTPPGDDASSPKFGFPHYDVVRLRHKLQKPSNDAAFERLKDRLFLPEIPGCAGSRFSS